MPFGNVSYRRTLWTLIAVGTTARLIVAFSTGGHADINAWVYAAISLDDPEHFYTNVNRSYQVWPYPPGFLPFIQGAEWLHALTGVTFAGFVRVPAILADAALAWCVQHHLGTRGAGERARLCAAALVALGPAFAASSGYHGQFDSVAILPAVAAFVLWERTEAAWRPYAAGALLGVGAGIKVVPILLLLALVPRARSLGEAARLVTAAVAIPAALLAPFALVDFASVREALDYTGRSGLGGLNLLLDPSGPLTSFGVEGGQPTDLVQTLSDNARYILGPALLAVSVFLLRRRPDPALGACVVWLAVYAFGANMFTTYIVWGLPFFILAGYLREAALVQVVMLPALIVSYVLVPARDTITLHGWEVSTFYTAPMIVLWGLLTAGLGMVLRRAGPAT